MMGAGADAATRRIIVLGGTSEIAAAIVRELQRRSQHEVLLAGRGRERLERMAASLRAAGCSPVITLELDALELDRHAQLLAEAFAQLGGADLVILAVGMLGPRGPMLAEVEQELSVLATNALGATSLLLHAGDELRKRGRGWIVVLSSVAAQRPRRVNAIYGASKAALDYAAQWLREELRGSGVRVLVVRPGFVATKMTDGLEPAPFATTPERVAEETVRGIDRGASTVWVPASLRALMAVMRLLPSVLFRRISR